MRSGHPGSDEARSTNDDGDTPRCGSLPGKVRV